MPRRIPQQDGQLAMMGDAIPADDPTRDTTPGSQWLPTLPLPLAYVNTDDGPVTVGPLPELETADPSPLPVDDPHRGVTETAEAFHARQDRYVDALAARTEENARRRRRAAEQLGDVR